MLERSICNYSLPTESAGDSVPMSEDLPETIYERIWLVRKLSVFACFCVTGFFAYSFVDYNKVNNRLLEDIRRQNADLKQKMEVMQVSNRASYYAPQDKTDSIPQKALVDPLTGGMDDTGEMAEDESSEDDDTLSFNSTRTDRTWLGIGPAGDGEDNLSVMSSDEDVEDHDFLSAFNTNNNSPDLQDVLSSTLIQVDQLSQLLTPVKSGERPKGSRRSSRACTPSPLDTSHGYNLRKRKGTPQMNSLCQKESPHTFAKEVIKASNIFKRNSRKVDLACSKIEQSSTTAAYSSDET